MTEKAIIFTTDNKIELRDLELKDGSLLKALQAVVGGHIKIVHPRYLTHGLVMVVNEEGLIEGLPLNLYASILYGFHDHGQPIVGNVAILDQGYRGGEPDIVGLGELLALDRYVYFKKIFREIPKQAERS